MKEWFKQSEEDRKLIIQQTSIQTNLTPTAVEKDFWVMIVLNALYKTQYAPHLVFKGGTSLSKAWNLIQRFSEDIDLALDREYLGFPGELGRKRVTSLRKAACEFVINQLKNDLEKSLSELGAEGFELRHIAFERSDTDPVAIELRYEPLTEKSAYVKPQVLIEISARSLREPFELRSMRSHIAEFYPNQTFIDNEIEIPTVLPKRTFLEKMFLLHEEFQKPEELEIRSYRMTRHLYDLGKMIDSGHANEAIEDQELYRTIVKHREMLTKVSWVNYKLHTPQSISFIPPERVIKEWENDYKEMSESMFQGKVLPFHELISKLNAFNEIVRSLEWSL